MGDIWRKFITLHFIYLSSTHRQDYEMCVYMALYFYNEIIWCNGVDMVTRLDLYCIYFLQNMFLKVNFMELRRDFSVHPFH